MRVDLHIHTTASDGAFSPERVVEELRREGIGLCAITDHDTTASVPLVAGLAQSAGLKLIPGVEISSNHGPLVCHVLAYGVDIHHPGLQDYLSSNRKRFADAQLLSLQRVAEQGFAVDFAAFENYTYDPARGGWKALNFLIDQGVCENVGDFFQRIIKGKAIDHLPVCPPTPDAIAIVRQAGGMPVLAHPGESLKKLASEEQVKLLETFKDCGLGGLECFSTYHALEENLVWRARAKRLGLLVTAGSDFHGPFTPARRLGHPRAAFEDLDLGPLLP